MRHVLVQVARHPRLTLAALGLLTALAAAQLPRLEIETDGRSLIPAHHPVVEADRELQRRFGISDPLLVAYLPSDDGGVFAPAALERLRSLTARVRRLEGVDPDRVTSLATVPNLSAAGGVLALDTVLPEGPLGEAEAAAVARAISGQPLWDGLLVSADRTAAAIIVELARGADRRAVLSRLRAAVAEPAGDDGRVVIAGAPLAETELGEHVVGDLARLIPLAVAVIGALLWAVFRRPSRVLLALAAVLAAVVWTLGAMAALGRPLYLVTATLPVILVAVGTADLVHIFTAFDRRAARRTRPRTGTVVAAVLEVAAPVVATSVTTAVGFLAFAASSMPPLRDFGLFASFGVLAAMAIALTGVPAGLALARRPPAARDPRPRRPSRTVHATGWLRRPRWVIAGWAAAVALGAAAASRLEVQDSWIANFRPSSPVVEADRLLNRTFLGTHSLILVVDGGRPDAAYEPRLLSAVDRLSRRLEALPAVGGTRSAADLVRAIDGDLAGRSSAPDSPLPETSSGIAETLLVASMAGDGEADRWVDVERRRLLVRVFLRGADYRRVGGVLAAARAAAAEELPAEVRTSAAGDAAVGHAAVGLVVGDQLRSLALALLGVGLALALQWRSPRAAALHLVPVAAAVPLTFGLMAVLGWNLGIATSTFAAVAIGIGVDASVHLLARVNRARRRYPEAMALRAALAAAGRPIAINSAAVAAGFATLTLSATPPIRAMGALVAFSLVAAACAALTLLPALLSYRPGLLPASTAGRRSAG